MNAIPYIRPELAGVEPLQALLPALGLLACGLSEDQIVVEDNDRAERAHRAVLTSTQLLLTSRQILAGQESPERLYRLFRASVAHAVAHRRYSRPALTTNTLKPLGVAVVSAIEDARVERLLMRHYPGVRRWFLEQLAPQPNSGDFSFESLMARMDRALLDPTYEDDNYWVNKAKRLFDEAMDAHGLEAYDEFRAVASILANDLGQMRVRFDPQHYVVPSRYRDDNSYLWHFPEQNQAPEEAMALPESLASRKTATSNSAGDAQQEECEELELGRFAYPEWHHQLDLWRSDWCTVVEKLPGWSVSGPGLANAFASQSLNPLALRSVLRLSRRHRLRRQWEGDDIDLNAAIEVLVDRRLSLQPEARLFMRPGRETGASSILLLLDLSESTNEQAGTSGQTLLDIEKQAAFLLADATMSTEDRIAIHGFSSNTRTEVDYHRILEFGSPLQGLARARLASVPARHSTRIGAALRHATAIMKSEAGNHRAILLVTDGEPADIDVFDPLYLIEDARVAVHQARQAGVRVFCIAVDSNADHYVRRIFGWRDYCITENASALPAHLQRAYGRLISN
jgi:nitric oxide reductase NorD protein